MKSVTNYGAQDLILFLQTVQSFFTVELFTITLKDGTVLRLTEWDAPGTFGTQTFSPGPPYIDHGKIEEIIGCSVSAMDLTLRANPGDMLGSSSVPILQSIALGQWDGATTRLDRLYLDSNKNAIGSILRFLGFLGDVHQVGRTYAVITANAMTEQLNVKLPLNLIQPTCIHTLYNAGCTLNPATFKKTSSVQTASTVNTIYCGLTDATGYYDLGTIKFTSGPNSGLLASIKQYTYASTSPATPAQIRLTRPLPELPQTGDAFTVLPGCNKLQATCINKFNNRSNYLGFDFVPAPESAF